MLNRLDFQDVPGASDLRVPGTGEYDVAKITLSVVPALHFGAVLERVWLDLIVVDGAVLRRDFVDAGGVDDWAGKVESVRQLEYVANKLDVAYLTRYDEEGVPDGFRTQLAELIADIWRARAMTLFPDRVFDIYVDSVQGDGPTVHLEQDDRGVPVPFRAVT